MIPSPYVTVPTGGPGAGSDFVETSGAALLSGGLPELKKLLQQLEGGGVLFIDEAYQLNPKMNPSGAQVREVQLVTSWQ